MTAPLRAPHAPAADPRLAQAERLRGVARQLEGVFVEQLFKAMRETVPDGGMVDGGSGEAMFSSMLDQHLAGQVPARWSHGLAEAVYRQLAGRAGLEATGDVAGATPETTATAAHSSSSPSAPIL